MTGFSNPGCFASESKDCAGPLNREHYVSDSVLSVVSDGNRTVWVRNLPFQAPGVHEQKAIAGLTSKILCELHNNLLSPYDAEAARLSEAMCRTHYALGKRATPPDHVLIDGDLLERWMLKTLIGGVTSRNFLPKDSTHPKEEKPPLFWIESFFRGKEITAPMGLYLSNIKEGEVLTTPNYDVGHMLFYSLEGNICGLCVFFWGFRFTLLMANLESGVKSVFDDMLYRPEGILFGGQDRQVIFKWAGGHRSEPLMVRNITGC